MRQEPEPVLVFSFQQPQQDFRAARGAFEFILYSMHLHEFTGESESQRKVG